MLNVLEEPRWQAEMRLAFEREERFRKDAELARRFQLESDTVASLKQLSTVERLRRDVMESDRIRREGLEGERVRREVREAARMREFAAQARAEEDLHRQVQWANEIAEIQPTVPRIRELDWTPRLMNRPVPNLAPTAIPPDASFPLTRSERLNEWLKVKREKTGFVWYLGITVSGFVLAVLGVLFALLPLL